MPLKNHFAYTSLTASIDIPNVNDIDTTNSPSQQTTGALGKHADSCLTAWNVKPVFVLVDFYDRGPAVETADRLNGVVDPVGRKDSGKEEGSGSGAVGVRVSGGVGGVALVGFLGAAVLMA